MKKTPYGDSINKTQRSLMLLLLHNSGVWGGPSWGPRCYSPSTSTKPVWPIPVSATSLPSSSVSLHCTHFVWKPQSQDRQRIFIKNHRRASLIVQWLRICLPKQVTKVSSLVREDPTCCGAAKPQRHNYWARTPQPMLHNKRSHCKEQPPLSATRESLNIAMKTKQS